MSAYANRATITEDRKLVLQDVPFEAGDPVEVIIQSKRKRAAGYPPHRLRGVPADCIDPCEPVAADDWEAAS